MQMQLFNIYYINYDKAFELSMLIDNRLQEQQSISKDSTVVVKGDAALDTEKLSKIPLLEKIIPKASIELNSEGSRVKNVIDNFKVVSTKSTVLNAVYNKSSEIKKLVDSKIGMLIRIRNIRVRIDNASDILAIKSLLSGVIRDIPVEGMNGMDVSQLFEVLLKDSAYLLTADFGEEQVAFKIPMKAENEMESQYSISDLEIGPLTVLGIYRGKYDSDELYNKINRLQDLQTMANQASGNNLMESDEDDNPTKKQGELKTHFVDVIAIIQELTIK